MRCQLMNLIHVHSLRPPSPISNYTGDGLMHDSSVDTAEMFNPEINYIRCRHSLPQQSHPNT